MQAVTEWRVPVQQRSRRRFDQILDAADAELAEVGWHRFTMESVGMRANGSIGSVYRYFPNKLSLIAALVDSQNEQLRQVFETPADDGRPFEDVVQELIDKYGAAVRRTPGMVAVGRAAMVDHEAHQLFRSALEPARQWMAGALRHRLPAIEEARLEEAAAVLVLLIESLLLFSNQPDPPSRDVILRELRLILRGYMNELTREHDQRPL